jgi:hypothetical protein
MNGLITLLAILLATTILVFVPTLAEPYAYLHGKVTIFDCGNALLVCAVMALVAGILIRRVEQHGQYLLRVFLLALLIRVAIGTAIFVFNGQDFFGGDAWTYDFVGQQQLQAWGGDNYAATFVDSFIGKSIGSGWGMVYLVAALYGLIGRNMLAVQFFNTVVGAATAPIIFLAAREVFNNSRVAKLAAIAVAFYPSLVLWSSQGLKDGPIVFSLAVCILTTLRLGKKFSAIYVLLLVSSLFCVLALRFYVFYMLLVAIIGAFVIGMRAVTAQSLARQFLIIIVLGLAMTYLGVTRYANVQFEQYGSLQQLQMNRLDASRSAQSGFGQDIDISTGGGALQTIPLGLLYLLFAPFPWQLGSVRQILTLPEMVIWWISFPFLVLGLWFSIKHRLRQMSPILLFTTMLTLAYSVFQGNIGTAYRQRSQLLVFYFIFVAIGFVLIKEKRENKAVDAERAQARPTKRHEDQVPVAG